MPERFATVLLPIKKGLHVLRYVSATDMMRPPRVIVSGKPGADEGLSLLFSPDAADGTLTRFDDCVAIRATHPAVLMVTTMTDPLGVSTDVELKLEPIVKADVRPAVPAGAEETTAPAPLGRFLVEGHVQKHGDMRAGPSGWLGSATGEERIEAFAVSWTDSLKGVRLAYGCEMPGRGRHTARIPGQMVGAKGQSTAITRVFFELTGSQADQFEFLVTASFRGAPPRTVTGQKIELAGPSGGEPLTGLKVDLRARQESAATGEPIAVPDAVVAAAAAPQQGRVRVFRAANVAK